MAVYFKLKNPAYSTEESPVEKRMATLKNIRAFFASAALLAMQVFAKIKAAKNTQYVLRCITQALGYIGVFIDTVTALVAKKMNLQQGLDFIVGIVNFFVIQSSSVAGVAIDSAWKVLRQLPFLIGMFLADREETKEKLYFLTMKNAIGATIGGLIGLGMAAIGLIIAPHVMVPLLITATILIALPVIKNVVKHAVLPVLQYIFKETMTTILGKERYKRVGAAISQAAKSFIGAVKDFVGWESSSDEKKVTTLERVEATAQPLDSTISKKTNRPYLTLNAAQVFNKTALLSEAVISPKERPKESFDYFKYVLKEKRPISALLKDIVLHRKQLEQVMHQEATFLDRVQYKKRKDKVQALKLLAVFLLQWQQLEKNQSAYDENTPKAIILREKKGHIVSIPFNDLAADRDKLVKQFNDYILDHYPHALSSILYRGAVDTLIKEAYAWIKRPTVADLEKTIEEYHAEYKASHDGANSSSMVFLLELFRKTHDMLYHYNGLDIVACDVQGLGLSRDELVDATKKRELYEKIEGFAIRTYPEFAKSYQSRGREHTIFRSIMHHIYFYESNEAALEITPKSVASIAT